MYISSARRRAVTNLAALAVLAGLVPLALSPRQAAAATVPTGFSDTRFVRGFGGRLTQMTFAPDGRLFVSEKQGSVRIVRDGVLLSQPFLTVATNTESEKGLKGIAFDPAYAANRYVYIYYTDANTLLNKVSRFTTRADNPNLADPGSERVLVSGIDSGIFHSGGALTFGPDGKLYVSTGDASSSQNSQRLGNLNGKILRINRDGSVPADNPFVGQTGARPEIWAYGLRNPFTFAFNSSGRLFINDVGDATWEEINDGARGANYGWPTCEGPCSDPRFVNPIHAYRHDSGPGKSITGAVFYNGGMFPDSYAGDYFFGDYVGNYIKSYDPATGQVRDFATDALYPVDLDVGPDGALYYLSVENKEVHRIAYGGTGPTPTPSPTPPQTGNLIREGGFESSGPDWPAPWRSVVRSPAQATIVRSTTVVASGNAALRVDVATPSEDWYVQLLQSEIPLAGGQVHSLSFDARASSDRSIRVAFQRNAYPYGVYFQRSVAITADWRRYEVSFTPATDDARALFNFNLGGTSGQVWLDNVSLTVGPDHGEPPVASITSPAAGTRYRATDVITFSGGSADAEDGTLPATALRWEVLFHHDTHTHPFVEPFSGAAGGSFTAPDTGETSPNVWFRIHLTATDSDGNEHEVTRDVTPVISQVTLATQPSGLSLTLDGVPGTAPRTFTGVVGLRREVGAAPTQTLNGVSYRFVRWSDGGAPSHVIVTPASPQTFTAVYEPAAGPSGNLFTNGGFEKSGSGWLSPWNFTVRSPARATATRATGDPATGTGALRVDVSTAGDDWNVQVRQPGLSLVAAVEHTLTFAARASTARTIRIAFQRNASPWPVYFERSFSITTTWARYTIRFTPTTSDSAALFNFNIGTRTGRIWIDDVSLTR